MILRQMVCELFEDGLWFEQTWEAKESKLGKVDTQVSQDITLSSGMFASLMCPSLPF